MWKQAVGEYDAGITCFVALRFIALHKYCVVLLIEGLWQPCGASLWAPFFQQHLYTSCLCVTLW